MNNKTFIYLDKAGYEKGKFRSVRKIEYVSDAPTIVHVYSDTMLIGIVNLGPGELIAYYEGQESEQEPVKGPGDILAENIVGSQS